MLKISCFRLLITLIFCLLGNFTKAAVYAYPDDYAYPGDGTTTRLKMRAQATGNEYINSVCGIFMSLAEEKIFIGSGFLISKPSTGPARVVTAANIFYNQRTKEWLNIKEMKLTFSGDIIKGPYTNVTRVYTRASFEVGTTYDDDIAVVEVDTALLPSVCSPLPLLNADVGDRLDPCWATHIGYSPFALIQFFGFNFDKEIKLYGGPTRVKYGLIPETIHPYFTAEAVTAESIETLKILNRIEFDFKFDCTRTIKGQSLLHYFGRGGPLMLPLEGRPTTVAGIYSRLQGVDRRYFWQRWLGLGALDMLVCYEPIMPHVAWLQSPDLRVGSGKIFEFSVPV